MITMWSHRNIHIHSRSHPDDIQSNPCAARVDTGVHHQSGARPSAIRAPRPRKSVTTIQKIRPRIR